MLKWRPSSSVPYCPTVKGSERRRVEKGKEILGGVGKVWRCCASNKLFFVLNKNVEYRVVFKVSEVVSWFCQVVSVSAFRSLESVFYAPSASSDSDVWAKPMWKATWGPGGNFFWLVLCLFCEPDLSLIARWQRNSLNVWKRRWSRLRVGLNSCFFFVFGLGLWLGLGLWSAFLPKILVFELFLYFWIYTSLYLHWIDNICFLPMTVYYHSPLLSIQCNPGENW